LFGSGVGQYQQEQQQQQEEEFMMSGALNVEDGRESKL
jgi:hypothetical protein